MATTSKEGKIHGFYPLSVQKFFSALFAALKEMHQVLVENGFLMDLDFGKIFCTESG